MATAKKKPASKKSTTSATRVTTKKPVTKKVAPKKRTATKKATRSTKKVQMQTLRVAKSDRPFFSFQPTIQTVYWLIISMSILALGSWVMYLHTEINNLYDAIEMNDATYDAWVVEQEGLEGEEES